MANGSGVEEATRLGCGNLTGVGFEAIVFGAEETLEAVGATGGCCITCELDPVV